MNDLISRQAAIDALKRAEALTRAFGYHNVIDTIRELPSTQPEQSNASEFWRKRADYYSDMCMNLIGEMGKGVKIESVEISENGIEFIKEQPSAEPERESTKWIPHKSIFGGLGERVYTCNKCGYNIGFHVENFCPNCGARADGEG